MSPYLNLPEKWDQEVDLLILGGGTAGMPAAIEARKHGLSATILEWRPQTGGSLAMIVGAIAFAGTEEQKEAGIEDGPELMCQDLIEVGGAVPEIAKTVSQAQLEAYHIFREEGFVWPGIVDLPGHSARRGMGWILGYGRDVVKCLEKRALKDGAQILFRHRATELIVNGEGQVLGAKVEARGKDTPLYFKARKGVILATGGFGRNQEMVHEYAPHMENCVPKMPVGHMGDGLKMALNVGAATKDIGVAVAGSWPVSIDTHSRCIWALDWGGIMVNAHGKRFYAENSEEGFYGRMTETGMRQPGGYYWVIFNQSILDHVGTPQVKGDLTERNMAHFRDIDNCTRVEAESVEELAGKMEVPVSELVETIGKYNSDIDTHGYDTVLGRRYQFGKARSIVKIEPPKLMAAKCVTCTTSLKGGLKVDPHCRVLDNYDRPIRGLYAAGEVAGGLWAKSYMLAVMTSAAMAQGIIAGRAASTD